MRWLRPSYSSLDDMMRAGPATSPRGEPVLNLLFHSSEAIVGGSPYNRTPASSTPSSIGSSGSWRSRRRSSARSRVTFAEFRDAHVGQRPRAFSTSRRTCRPTRRPTRCCRGSSAPGPRTRGTRSRTSRIRRGPARRRRSRAGHVVAPSQRQRHPRARCASTSFAASRRIAQRSARRCWRARSRARAQQRPARRARGRCWRGGAASRSC